MSKSWTPVEDNTIRRGVADGKTHAAIGAELGRTGSSVRGRARVLGVAKFQWTSAEATDRIVALLRSGLSDVEAAREAKVSPMTVNRIRHRNNIPQLPTNVSHWRERRRNGSLDRPSRAQSALVTALEDGPKTVAQLAAATGRTDNNVSARLRRLRRRGLAACEGRMGPAGVVWVSTRWWLREHAGLIHAIANRVWARYQWLDVADLVSEANSEAVRLLRRSKIRGNKLTTFVYEYAHHHLRQFAAREHLRGVSIPRDALLKHRFTAKIGSMVVGEDGEELHPTVSPDTEAVDREEFWQEVLRRLPPSEEEVVRLRYLDGVPLNDIAVRLAVSRTRVAQLVQRALYRIKRSGVVRGL